MITIKRCIIICAYNEYPIKQAINIKDDDYIICADAGIKLAQNENIFPSLVIGDFDSLGKLPYGDNIIQLPVEKDDTDTLYCVKFAIEKGYREIIIVGGIGGRLDQTIANIQTLKFAFEQGCNIWLCDGKNKITYINNTSITVSKDNCKISVFSYSEKSDGVTITGAKYKVDNGTLFSNYPIGVSNEFENEEVIISVKNGELLIVLSRD